MRFITGLFVATAAALASASSVHGAITVTDLFTVAAPDVSPANRRIPGAINGWYQSHIAMGGQVVGDKSATTQANLWTSAAPAGIALSNSPNSSMAYGTNGSQQVGGYAPAGWPSHAAVWNGSVNTVVDLTPTSVVSSFALGTDGTHQVGRLGVMVSGSQSHAALWSGSAESLVDLHPADSLYYDSTAVSVRNGRQVGYSYTNTTTNFPHALTWTGSAASFVDLYPNSLYSSAAFGTDGTATVGYAAFMSGIRPALWSASTAATYVSLMPASGYSAGAAYDTDGGYQVGTVSTSSGNIDHAALWNGTAASFVDLHSLLPAGQFASSSAYTISNGQVYGLAIDTAGKTHAIVWNGVPEPTTALISASAVLLLARRRRHAA